MAYTANTGFRYFKSLSGNTAAPTPVPIKLANSTTLRIGDVVRVNTSGLLVTNGASGVAAGVLVGLTDENGINPFGHGIENHYGVTLTGDDTLTTASDNSTRAHYIEGMVIIDPAGDCIWLNKADGALTQTNLFQFFDIDASSRQIAASSASDTNGVFQLIFLDPEASGGQTADSTKGGFRLVENQLGLGIDSGTAKVAG